MELIESRCFLLENYVQKGNSVVGKFISKDAAVERSVWRLSSGDMPIKYVFLDGGIRNMAGRN